MKAHTITIMSRRRRRTRRRAIALVLAVCALAIPASAGAYSSPNAITGGTEQSSQPSGGSDGSSVNAITGGSSTSSAPGAPQSAQRVDPNYSSLSATTGAEQPRVVSGSPSGGGQGFDWPSALVGAGSAMALVALAGAAFLTGRRRTEVSPSASTS
jgi:hypothetical protein